MTISKRLRQSALLLAALTFVFAFASCDLMGEKDKKEDIEIEGTWDGGMSNYVTIDGDEYIVDNPDDWFWDYGCEVVSFDNDGFNGGEEGEGDCGYAVIKFTDHDSSPASVGKYTVLRWQNLETTGGVTTIDTCEGYGTYFDSAEEAEAGATSAAGYFASYSSSTLQ